MKKLTAILIALFLLLSCTAGLTESAPEVFEQVGINFDFADVMESSPYFMRFEELGILSRTPFISVLYLEYYPLDKEIMEQYDSFDEEMWDSVDAPGTGIRTELAYVIVTDLEDPTEAVEMLFGEDAEGAEVIHFAEAGGYRYCLAVIPETEEPGDNSAAAESGGDPEAVQQEALAIREDMERVRTALAERLRTAELYAPVDPVAGMQGQILSFETTDIDGHPVSSADLFRDNLITLVNLWGTWCHNCVDEMTELAEIHARLQEKGCGVVGVEYEQKPIDTMVDEIHAFLEEKNVHYPNAVMPEGNAILDAISAFPTTIFVDSEGKILTVPISGADVDEYESTIEKLLNGEQPETIPDAGAVTNDCGEYRVIVCDMKGSPVEGAVIQLCDDTTCAFQQTDANGTAVFSVGEQKVYEVHVLMVPEGYASDQGEYTTLDTYSDVNIILQNAG